jgi:hypothetical protein
MSYITEHLRSVNESYLQHFRHALSFAGTLLLASVVCFIHALIPFLFEKTGSLLINRLHDRMVNNRSKLSH